MKACSDIPSWDDQATYVELYGVKSGRAAKPPKFKLKAKAMYLLEEVYFSTVVTDLEYADSKTEVMFEVGLLHSSLKKAEEDLASITSLEELAIKLAMSFFPYSRDLALVALFCSVDSFKLGARKPDIRTWLYQLSLQDPDALAVAAKDPDFPKIASLLHGKVYSI